jgi:hypothetical protein
MESVKLIIDDTIVAAVICTQKKISDSGHFLFPSSRVKWGGVGEIPSFFCFGRKKLGQTKKFLAFEGSLSNFEQLTAVAFNYL